MTILHNNFSLEGAAKADCLAIGLRGNDLRFGPKADSCTAAISPLFNHLVGVGEQREDDADPFCRLDVHDHLELGRRLHCNVTMPYIIFEWQAITDYRSCVAAQWRALRSS